MEYLSQFDILQIRTRLQAGAPQPFDIMNLSGLQSALAAPRQSMFGEEIHAGLFPKAAILFVRLIENHAFYDGNKRIAVEALRLFLGRNGHALVASDDDAMQIARQVVGNHVERSAVEEWLRRGTTPTHLPEAKGEIREK